MRWREIINESVKKYTLMFGGFADENGRLPDWVPVRIAAVESLLKREDRVVWALRWERLIASLDFVGKDQQTIEKFLILRERFLKDCAVDEADVSMEKTNYNTMMGLGTRDEPSMAHHLSLPIAGIQNYVFGRQAPTEIYEHFEEAEEAWKQSRNQIIQHADSYKETGSITDDDDIAAAGGIVKMLDFGNGWAWWNLNRTYCKREGKAMGHCGNVPSAKVGDRILSLRKDMGDGNFRPSLTFILHGNGYLGEMKGRANEKPNPKYHDMIMALLLQPEIAGCSSGGYAAHQNFSLLDLPRDKMELLRQKKPELLSLHDELTLTEQEPSEENVESIRKRLDADIRENDFDYYDIIPNEGDYKHLIIRITHWDSRESYIKQSRDYTLGRLNEFFNKLPQELSDAGFNPGRAVEITKMAEDEYFNKIFDAILYYAYPDEFFLNDVDIKTFSDGSIATYIPVNSYLTPSTNTGNWGEDRHPFEHMREENHNYDLDAGYMEKEPSWSDIKGNIELDEVELMIAEYCFENGLEKPGRLRNIALAVAESDEERPYFSRDPNQMKFPFYDNH